MVTSRKERKCIDSSSAGRAGIFYCSSWRTVCWLPVPPPAGREDTKQRRGIITSAAVHTPSGKPVVDYKKK